MRGLLAGILFSISVYSGVAQVPLSSEEARSVEPVFQTKTPGGKLNCHIDTAAPMLDFAFRFEIGFVAHCLLRQFEGKQTAVTALLRATSGTELPAVVFREDLTVPGMPVAMRPRVDLKYLRAEIEFSGVFAAGEGDYQLELAIADDRGRLTHKSWKTQAHLHGDEEKAFVAMQPHTVSAVSLPPWKGASNSSDGLHLTVLLDAAPLNPRSYDLRAWDRGFLLGSLSSVLRQLPVASVRLVAFNLDQQREVFREDDFDRTSFRRLSRALSDLELGTVAYKTLQKTEGWSELLAKLVNGESASQSPSDAIIFLGPVNRLDQKFPEELLNAGRAPNPPLFYLEYFGSHGHEFPDSIQYLTSSCNGTTMKLHSPAELADAIEKLQRRLRRTATASNESPGQGR